MLLAGVGGLLLGLAGFLVARRVLASQLAGVQHERARVEEILATAPEGYLAWLSDGDDPVCAPRLAVLLGLAAGTQARWADVLERIDPDEQTALEDAVAALRDDGEAFDMVVGLVDGTRHVRVRGALAETLDGDRLAEVLWVADVTGLHGELDRRTRAHQDASVALDRLRRVLHAVPLPLWVRDDTLRVVLGNAAYLALSGGTVAEPGEMTEAASQRQARTLAATARAAETARTDRLPVLDRGHRMEMAVTETPLEVVDWDGSGPSMVTVGVALDATPLARAEAALALEQAMTRVALARLPLAVALFDAGHRLRFLNPAFSALVGLPEDTAETQPDYVTFLDLLRARRQLPEVADFRAFREAEMRRLKGLMEPFEDVLHMPDGRTLRRLLAPYGEGGFLLSLENVTGTLDMERQRNTLRAVLDVVLESVGDGVAIVAGDGRLERCNGVLMARLGLAEDARPTLQEAVLALDPAVQGSALQALSARESLRAPLASGGILTLLPMADGGTLLVVRSAP